MRVAAPAVPVTVKSPFEVQLSGPLLLKPGQAARLTGKVVRQAVCKEPIRLTLTGLPAGVALTPAKPVAAGESSFTLELKAPMKLPPGPGKIELRATAVIAGPRPQARLRASSTRYGRVTR